MLFCELKGCLLQIILNSIEKKSPESSQTFGAVYLAYVLAIDRRALEFRHLDGNDSTLIAFVSQTTSATVFSLL